MKDGNLKKYYLQAEKDPSPCADPDCGCKDVSVPPDPSPEQLSDPNFDLVQYYLDSIPDEQVREQLSHANAQMKNRHTEDPFVQYNDYDDATEQTPELPPTVIYHFDNLNLEHQNLILKEKIVSRDLEDISNELTRLGSIYSNLMETHVANENKRTTLDYEYLGYVLGITPEEAFKLYELDREKSIFVRRG